MAQHHQQDGNSSYPVEGRNMGWSLLVFRHGLVVWIKFLPGMFSKVWRTLHKQLILHIKI